MIIFYHCYVFWFWVKFIFTKPHFFVPEKKVSYKGAHPSLDVTVSKSSFI